MKRKTLILGGGAILILAGVFLFYFFYLGSPSRQVLAQVNGEKITVEQFDKEVAKIEDPLRQMYKEEPQPLLEEMIVKTLLLQEAKREGISPPIKTYKDKEPLSPEDSLIAELLKKKFPAPPTVTKEEIKDFYSMFKGQMAGKSLEQIAPSIEELIREGKQQEQLRDFIGELRSKAKIEIDQIQKTGKASAPGRSPDRLSTRSAPAITVCAA